MDKVYPGQKFGRWTVIEFTGEKKRGTKIWLCQCSCPKRTISKVREQNLLSGKSTSCGCWHKEKVTKHNLRNLKEYQIWSDMKTRCINPNNKFYCSYGGRGITVCDEWQEFENFYRDMGDCPEGYSIERINNDKGYSKDNCKWIPKGEQQRNQRRTKITLEQAREIRQMRKQGFLIKDIAKNYGISAVHAGKIINNLKWKE